MACKNCIRWNCADQRGKPNRPMAAKRISMGRFLCIIYIHKEKLGMQRYSKCNSYTKLSILSARTWKICVHIAQSLFWVHKITRYFHRVQKKRKQRSKNVWKKQIVNICLNVDRNFLTKFPMEANINGFYQWNWPVKKSLKKVLKKYM